MSEIKKIIKVVLEELKKINIDYVLVGGGALELQNYRTETLDVDLVITIKEFSNLSEKLSLSKRFKIQEEIYFFIGAFFTSQKIRGGIDLEFLSPKPFAGNKNGDDFFEFIKKYYSLKTKFGPVAKPEVVWYLRLVNPSWKIYLQKILREIKLAKIPYKNILPKVMKIATNFGTDEIVKKRIIKLKERI